MPLYAYECPRCGSFEALRKLAERDAPAACPQCRAVDSMRLTTSPARAGGRAFNDMSAPGDAADGYGRYNLRHQGGCGCCVTH